MSRQEGVVEEAAKGSGRVMSRVSRLLRGPFMSGGAGPRDSACVRGERLFDWIWALFAFAFFVQLRQFQVVGRLTPSQPDQATPVYRMRMFARNKVLASSRFWYFLRKLKKIKKANGEILAINEIKEKRPTYVKNFGVWLRYDSRTGVHNMYKEVRDLTQTGALSQIYAEMAGRHRASASSIQVREI